MSDSSPTPQVPAPEPKDSAEVVRCLEAAREMWELAQLKEAVRWVQRGAEAAEQDGNDMRALKLARLGADLAAHANAVAEKEAEANSVDVTIDTDEPAETSGAAASPAATSPGSEEPAPKEGAPKEPAASLGAAPLAPASEATDKSTSVTPVPGAVEKAAPRVSEKPAATRSFPTPSRPPVTAERASARPAATTTASRPPVASVSPKAASAPGSGGASNGVAPNSNVPLAELIAGGKAERVTVKRSALDANVLVVRSAEPNKAGPRARQAVLVYVDEDVS